MTQNTETDFLKGIELPATALTVREAEWLAMQTASLPKSATIVHLGVGGGASIICSRVGNPLAHIIGVDCNKRCADLKLDADILIGDSRLLPFDGPVDFLFIDADHAEGSVIADIQNWHGHITPGGIIAFHDYGNAHLRWCRGVKVAVDRWDWTGWERIDAPDSIRAYRRCKNE